MAPLANSTKKFKVEIILIYKYENFLRKKEEEGSLN